MGKLAVHLRVDAEMTGGIVESLGVVESLARITRIRCHINRKLPMLSGFLQVGHFP